MDGRNKQHRRNLFGGALSCELDARYEDVSKIRQVPDHQEVFADPTTNISLIIEINELNRELPASMLPVEYVFHDLAQANECQNDDITIINKHTIKQQHMPHFEYVTRSCGILFVGC